MLAAPDPNKPDAMSSLPNAVSFHAVETGMGNSGLYKVYGGQDGLHFAWVADKLPQESGAAFMMFGLIGALIHAIVVKPAIKRQQELESHYDSIEPGAPQFLGLDPRNHTVKPHDVRSANMKKASFLTRGPKQVGVLELQTNDGRSRQLRLISTITAMQVEKSIRSAIPSVEGSLT